MQTFIDRLETDLVRVCSEAVAPRRSRPAPLRRLSRGARFRVLAGLSVAAAVMTPAIAIGLSPILRAFDGRQANFEGQALSTTADAPPAEQLALLGILRDPPPGAYVDAAALGPVFLPGLKGIRTNYIRLLPPAPGFPRQLLITVASSDFGPARFNPSVGAYTPTEAKNGICIERMDTGGVGGDCTDTSVLTSGHWLESAGLDGYGLVPDGVATVVLHYGDHPDKTERVTENTFSWRGHRGPAGPTTNGGAQPSPGPTPEFPASITWLDAHGNVLSTHGSANAVP
jgi:hypothetical protein